MSEATLRLSARQSKTQVWLGSTFWPYSGWYVLQLGQLQYFQMKKIMQDKFIHPGKYSTPSWNCARRVQLYAKSSGRFSGSERFSDMYQYWNTRYTAPKARPALRRLRGRQQEPKQEDQEGGRGATVAVIRRRRRRGARRDLSLSKA